MHTATPHAAAFPSSLASGPSLPAPSSPSSMAAPFRLSHAGGWADDHWAGWLQAGLRIVLILVIAVVLRTVVRRAITRTIERMNRGAEAAAATTLGGLLVNAERRKQRSEAIGSVLRSVASFLIMGTAALTVLSVLRINLAPLLASAGVAGVAIGFGARNLVTDFLSGVFMILEDQYGVGDVIDAGVASGTVVEVGLRVTKLRGEGGEIWYVRNGEVKRIGNMSQGWATALVDVQVGIGEDLERARAVVAEVAEEMGKDSPWDEWLWEPVAVLGLDSVGAESVVLQAQARTMPGHAAAIARELRWRVKRAFDAAGIEIAGGGPSSSAAERPAAEAEGAEPAGEDGEEGEGANGGTPAGNVAGRVRAPVPPQPVGDVRASVSPSSPGSPAAGSPATPQTPAEPWAPGSPQQPGDV